MVLSALCCCKKCVMRNVQMHDVCGKRWDWWTDNGPALYSWSEPKEVLKGGVQKKPLAAFYPWAHLRGKVNLHQHAVTPKPSWLFDVWLPSLLFPPLPPCFSFPPLVLRSTLRSREVISTSFCGKRINCQERRRWKTRQMEMKDRDRRRL